MGRLLREEDVLKIIRNGWSNHYSCKDMCDEIIHLPTAFNVEAVVKELDKRRYRKALEYEEDYEMEVMINANFYDAIEIVKGGVK